MLAVGRLKSLAADLSVARTQQEIALARLGQLLGRRIDDATLGTVLAAPRAIEPRLQTLLDLAQAGSPAIQKAQAQAKALESVIAERRADLSPEVVLRAERQYGNFSYGNAAPENRLFIGISSRFGAGLSSQSNVEGARAQHQAALAEVAVQSRAVNEQVFADYALASSSDSRMEALGAALEAAAQVSTSYARQFLAGRKTWLDVMNAARELAQTEVQLADIQAAQVVVTWRLAIISDGLAAVVGGRQ
jgi:adhesin transport system outer membrane protein